MIDNRFAQKHEEWNYGSNLQKIMENPNRQGYEKERFSNKSRNKLGFGNKDVNGWACKYGCAYEGL